MNKPSRRYNQNCLNDSCSQLREEFLLPQEIRDFERGPDVSLTKWIGLLYCSNLYWLTRSGRYQFAQCYLLNYLIVLDRM